MRKTTGGRNARNAVRFLPLLLLLLIPLLPAGRAVAEEAENISSACRYEFSSKNGRYASLTDGKYTTRCRTDTSRNPWMIISSDKPAYGLYLCFETMPDGYAVQRENGAGEWETVYTGDPEYYHVFYAADGWRRIRIYATSGNRTAMGFNEVAVFGEGKIPGWVQRWEPAPEKADILFLVAHPDDELLFLGGALAWYGVEKQKKVTVAYLTKASNTRRSEALNGLWTLGIRTYPEFGEFRDVYDMGSSLKRIYTDSGGKEEIQGWVTELYRKYRPDVVVTQDPDGEYGHMQHKMVADAAEAAFSLAADPAAFPESAACYGTWHVMKLYQHLYGAPRDWTQFNWDIPLASLGGKTVNEKAEEAFAEHVTQQGQGRVSKGVFAAFSVAEYGVKRYPNTAFGLCASRVGPDTAHDDLLENTLPVVAEDEEDE